MSLKEYKRKRVLSKTPEPDTSKASNSAQLHFVVQKHAASHLHYDFRLEMGGVLKSWAIPKGPSLNPKDKRLAIMVEDHPYAYKDFEGTIPAGNYGAGNVIIWDEGFYELIKSDKSSNVKSALKKGHLHFILYGKKLKGSFSLVRLEKSKEKNAWLFIKSPDEHSATTDILKKDKSVRTQLTIDKINKPILKKTPKARMPSVIKPMLATLIDKPFNSPDWWYEIKWDGYRILAFIDLNKVRLMTRDHKDYTSVYPSVADELSQLGVRAVLDGEMVIVDKKGKSHFQLLQQYQKTGQGNLVYYVFDMIWLDGHDLSHLPLHERYQALTKIVSETSQVKISEHVLEEGENFFKIALDHHLEGIMAKEINSHYEAGRRSRSWLKIKAHHQQEAVICGYTAPRGSRKHIGALVLGVYEKGKLIYIGHTAGRLNEILLSELKKRLDKLIQKESAIKPSPKTNTPATWVKPQLVCEVSFNEWTDAGHLRQPIFLGLREDKLARSVHREKEIPLKKVNSKAMKKTQDNKVELSHLSKLYWEEEGITKGDLMAYYQKIASTILPYLKNRPESLNRHPNGIHGSHFFQKNLEHHPSWVKTHRVFSKSEEKNIEYLLCQNAETLMYMVNLGCIEINPWLSRLKYLEKPDFCVIDLDPEDIDFPSVIQVAQAVHELLDSVGADSYCKTSGSRGLHICIPLAAKYDYEQSKQFAQLIATVITNKLPKITSIERSPKKRQGKVYLDYLQNRHGQTIVAPYSARPRPGATVSAPLLWKEVKKGLSPQDFTINNMAERLAKVGDLWKPVLGKGVNLEKCLAKLQKLVNL